MVCIAVTILSRARYTMSSDSIAAISDHEQQSLKCMCAADISIWHSRVYTGACWPSFVISSVYLLPSASLHTISSSTTRAAVMCIASRNCT
jgi:hypothetical protein